MATQNYVCKRAIGAKPVPRPVTAKAKVTKEKVKYVLSTSKADWFNAHSTCAAQGMELAKIQNSEENTIMRKLVWSVASGGSRAIWFGANDLRKEGYWNWSDGTPMRYKHFAAGEPNNFNLREDCGAIAYDQRWNDMNCKTRLLYVCEKRSLVKRVLKYQNWEYHVSTNKRNWYDAEKTCITWGGHLASISSSRENSIVVMALSRNTYHYWIGFNGIRREKRYEWSDRSRGSYSNWDYKQPGNNGSDEDCAAIWNNRKWHDAPCRKTMPFICKRKIGNQMVRYKVLVEKVEVKAALAGPISVEVQPADVVDAEENPFVFNGALNSIEAMQKAKEAATIQATTAPV